MPGPWRLRLGKGVKPEEERAPITYVVLRTEILQDLLAGGTPDLHPSGFGRLGRGFPALLPTLTPARVSLHPWPAPSAATAALAAPGSLGAALSHAQSIEIQCLALEGALHVAEHASVLLPWDLICGAWPSQVHRQIIFVGAVPAPSTRSHGSSESGSRAFFFRGCREQRPAACTEPQWWGGRRRLSLRARGGSAALVPACPQPAKLASLSPGSDSPRDRPPAPVAPPRPPHPPLRRPNVVSAPAPGPDPNLSSAHARTRTHAPWSRQLLGLDSHSDTIQMS